MLMGSPEGGQGRKRGEWRITHRFFSASVRHFHLHSVPKASLLALRNSKEIQSPASTLCGNGEEDPKSEWVGLTSTQAYGTINQILFDRMTSEQGCGGNEKIALWTSE